MHLSIVSGTVGRAGDPRENERAKSPLGQRFDRQLYPSSREIDNPSFTLMIHFLTAVIVVLCYVLLSTDCNIDDSVLIYAKYIHL